MGLFNFIYKLTNILSNKRKIKVFVIIALIILLLFWWSRGAFAAEPSPSDSMALTNYQLVLQDSMVTYLRNMYQTKPTGYNADNFNAFMNLFRYHFCFVQPSNNPNELFSVYFYNPGNTDNNPNIFTIDADWSIGLNSGTQFPCKIGQITPRYTGTISLTGDANRPTPTYISYGTSVYMPSDFYCVRSISINDFLTELGKYSSLATTYSTKDEQLQAITRSGFENEVNAINNVNSTMQDVNSSVEDVNQSVMDMIETIVDPYVNVSQQQLPSQEVTDGTAEPLNTLFDYIRNAFTGEPTGFSLPLPFVRW